jgi:hypothetical protein
MLQQTTCQNNMSTPSPRLNPQFGENRPYVYGAKGPTLGKGKACEPCRNRKVVSEDLLLLPDVLNPDILPTLL